jgi:hypothetical protein
MPLCFKSGHSVVSYTGSACLMISRNDYKGTGMRIGVIEYHFHYLVHNFHLGNHAFGIVFMPPSVNPGFFNHKEKAFWIVFLFQ